MTSEPTVEYAGIPLPEVEVFSNVLLSHGTTEKVLNALDPIKHIRQINMTGESLPKNLNSGPAKGLPNDHSERKVIKVGGRDVELRFLVGAFYIELDVENEAMLDEAVKKIKAACDATLPRGFSLTVGRYSKYRKTLRDYR
ncbi:methyl-coenzyme M reductase I operon protein D [Candidatus Methanoplasma termitum]|uniref:McrD protein n=1 Tax=Candidatus Methanoplasma termitum TaxID=1577791 RepID=A0A0A7LAM9_9ARCH|nr:methyl-coenzyme M reductase operon protein D [Candidatus Methanoplasma termitum]AIZ56099.1 methyl-coenzyme M reductase I operon protein D [Candidatus Methanoplasma termitum]MCL2334199.1 methyl-coenzyme M reductase operon protein D [Candidatus Methanoplasma sp.]